MKLLETSFFIGKRATLELTAVKVDVRIFISSLFATNRIVQGLHHGAFVIFPNP